MIKNILKHFSNMIKDGKNLTKPVYKNIKDIDFVNSALKNLFVKEIDNPKKPQSTGGCNYSKVIPTPLDNPKLICLSPQSSEFLGLDYESIISDEESAEYLCGNKIPEKAVPISHCYVGHQFGVFAGQLGDGRAISLGDTYGVEEEKQLWELQLKGSGLTPYSRFADGRAVLRSSIREFLCSEHLWALGIPTTRALSLVGSDSTTKRDPMYNGNEIEEQCAVVCRVAPTFFRFGSFEIFIKNDPLTGSSGPSPGKEKQMLPVMLEYIGKYQYHKLFEEFYNENNREVFYGKLYELICVRTAILVATWQSYGFCHGVLNTDNMSILGLTIDFGPFGFMEYLDSFFVCNHSDKNGRYSYTEQPKVCSWNLLKLGEAISSSLNITESNNIREKVYTKTFNNYYNFLIGKKLGLFLTYDLGDIKEDKSLIDELFTILDDFGFDLTIFFRNLPMILEDKESEFIEKMLKYSLQFKLKIEKLKPKMNQNMLQSLRVLKEANPMLLYNYGIDPEFVDVEMAKFNKFNELKNEKNYTNDSFNQDKIIRLKSWIELYKIRITKEDEKIATISYQKLKESINNLIYEEFLLKYPLTQNAFNNIPFNQSQKVLSDLNETIKSFKSVKKINKYRVDLMNKINPKFILRNHVVQKVIEKAEQGSYDELKKVYDIMISPFEEHNEEQFENVYDTSEVMAYNICVSCSS